MGLKKRKTPNFLPTDLQKSFIVTETAEYLFTACKKALMARLMFHYK